MANVVSFGKKKKKIHLKLSNQKLVRCSIFNIQHSNFECRILYIKLNPTFKSNVEYRISNQFLIALKLISFQNEKCKLSEISNISPYAFFQFKNGKLL